MSTPEPVQPVTPGSVLRELARRRVWAEGPAIVHVAHGPLDPEEMADLVGPAFTDPRPDVVRACRELLARRAHPMLPRRAA